jgi:hypothetical protein
LTDIVTGEKKVSVAILNNIICRDKNSTNIVTKAERKEYKIVFDKLRYRLKIMLSIIK